MTTQRPLAHLDGEFVLATAFLETWEPSGDEMAVLVKWVDVLDYETAKPIAPRLDHAWIWITMKAWNVRARFETETSGRFLLNEPVNFSARVRGYTRSDGTRDYGLRLTNFYPLTLTQQADLRKAAKKCEKANSTTITALACSRLNLKRMRLKLEDWRDYSDRSLVDARTRCLRIISRYEGILYPSMGRDYVNRLVEDELRGTEAQIEQHLAA